MLVRWRDIARLWYGRVPGQLVLDVRGRGPGCVPPETDACKRLIDEAARREVRSLCILGAEPLRHLDLLTAVIPHAAEAGIHHVRTGTGGACFRYSWVPGYLDRMNHLAEALAKTGLRNFWIDLDANQPAVHDEMRGIPRLTRGIELALPVFHAHGLHPSANLGIHRNVGGRGTWQVSPANHPNESAYLEAFFAAFRAALLRFFEFAHGLGFTMAHCMYPEAGLAHRYPGLRDDYGPDAPVRLYRFSAKERAMLYKALLGSVTAYRPHLRVATPRASLFNLYLQHSGDDPPLYTCAGGSDFLYVNAHDGVAYPCRERGEEPLGPYWSQSADDLPVERNCTRCDAASFRDSAALLLPFADLVRHPRALRERFRQQPAFRALWLDDLRYYRACSYFDGRLPLTATRIEAFAPGNAGVEPLPLTA